MTGFAKLRVRMVGEKPEAREDTASLWTGIVERA